MRALVAEDDPRIAADLMAALQAAGFRTEHATNGPDAWFRGGTEDYDLIVLDLGLPGLDGLTVLKRWRAEGCHSPVLILTARGNWAERVEGIDAGADDYLPKPFQMQELIARARALVRRSAGHGDARTDIGPLQIDMNRMQVLKNGIPVALTPLEFRLLAHLAMNRDRVLSALDLLDHLYGDDDSRDTNAVEAVITRLRRKLGPGVIATRRGFGYALTPDG